MVARTGNAQVVFNAQQQQDKTTFVMRWELQLQRPPLTPSSAPFANTSSATTSSIKLSWSAVGSTIPIVSYLIRYWEAPTPPSPSPPPLSPLAPPLAPGTTISPSLPPSPAPPPYSPPSQPSSGPIVREVIVASSSLETHVSSLTSGTTYFYQLQAWSVPVDQTVCVAGNNFRCSAWSPIGNATTLSSGGTGAGRVATSWHISPRGSALFGDGTENNTWPPDIQGRIDAAQVTNGHELVLHPGPYGNAFLRGSGSAEQLNLRGKLLNIRGRDGAANTIIDCQVRRTTPRPARASPPSEHRVHDLVI